MDELCEARNLVKTKKIEKVPPMGLFGSECGNDVCEFDARVKWGTM